jgi:hypothetical protein
LLLGIGIAVYFLLNKKQTPPPVTQTTQTTKTGLNGIDIGSIVKLLAFA